MSEYDVEDATLGARLAAEGIARCESAADAEWMHSASYAVWRCAQKYPEFTTDDVYKLMSPHVHTSDKRAMGGVMRRAQKLGMIGHTNRTRPSDRAVAHRNPKAIWLSLLPEHLAVQ